MTNRILDHASDLRANPKLDNLEESTLDITFTEHFQMQEWQAHAHASGILSTDEAQVIYRALGASWTESNGGWHKSTDKALKTTITLTMEQIGAAITKARSAA